jgi:hypothetical protein
LEYDPAQFQAISILKNRVRFPAALQMILEYAPVIGWSSQAGIHFMAMD